MKWLYFKNIKKFHLSSP